MEERLSKKDIKQIQEKGISLQKIEQQLQFFVSGVSKVNLEKSASINDGIMFFSNKKKEELCRFFDENKGNKSINKFVPASGAASRMFKFLTEFLTEFDSEKGTINAYINHKKEHDLPVFLVGLKDFPFYAEVKERVLQLHPNYYNLEKDEKDYLFIKTLLSPNCFDFSNKPKGILPFHNKNNTILTPVEEHLNETIFYKKEGEKAKVHFTISKEHHNHFDAIIKKYPEVNVSYSFQKESTDTIAVNLDNTPFRTEEGSLLFRPGGHGALIENLNLLESDIIFIKNIDNVSQNHIVDIIKYKKILGGLLLKKQRQIFEYLEQLELNNSTEELISEIKNFAKEKLNLSLPINFDKFQSEYKIELLFNELNRPIRVCGMVKNEGEPGGGPFWVKNENGLSSLQIVETSQINLKDKEQKKIVEFATHFNPVDLVCGIKDYKNNKFDLTQFVDEKTGFIVEKNKFGKPIKSFELPGLWNGAMANWITLFVEVPLSTFNPVKTVNDLLKPSHQPEDKEA
ncbi:DUF4301 family protein [uncultured Flavobacterium sp.]|uniref:DUF4301 family protein n=1 Tax=uncultured Flavobacterium sp. TaxID=165435 RepID=UPI0030EE1139|tara:strand:+ start:15422 stop:16963 length:1542 start_codon:yes stop_codon:yes gene_type:complete